MPVSIRDQWKRYRMLTVRRTGMPVAASLPIASKTITPTVPDLTTGPAFPPSSTNRYAILSQGGRSPDVIATTNKSSAQVGTSRAQKGAQEKSGVLCTIVRPRQPKSRSRGVRYSNEELAYLTEAAKKIGVTVNDYIKTTSLNGGYKPIQMTLADPLVRQELSIVKQQLTGIGNRSHRPGAGLHRCRPPAGA
jgi:hypothetical protein